MTSKDKSTLAEDSFYIAMVDASEVIPLRVKVLWPNEPARARLDEDGSPLALHFALTRRGEAGVVSVVSLFFGEDNSAQFRKFATDPDHQRRGYGTALLKHAFEEAAKRGTRRVWCNARVETRSYYENLGMELASGEGKRFRRGGIEYVIMEMKLRLVPDTTALHPGTGRPYELNVINVMSQFGAEITGLNLATVELTDRLISLIKEDLTTYRLLLFRDQGRIEGSRQVEVSSKLGELESTFYRHPRSPHPHIFRVSNDEAEGCTNVGRTGWHIDGTFQSMPFKYQTMHFHSVCEGGETHFLPLNELFARQDDATRERWRSMWMLTGRGGLAHPLVYQHPVRRDTTMLFHCGQSFCAGWGVIEGGKLERVIGAETIQQELSEACEAALEAGIGIRMDWREGDFAINDNLGNVHYASPGTQADRRSHGLRVLHRTTVAGDAVPMRDDGQRSFTVG